MMNFKTLPFDRCLNARPCITASNPTQRRCKVIVSTQSGSSDVPFVSPTSASAQNMPIMPPGSPASNGVHPDQRKALEEKEGLLQKVKEYFFGSNMEKQKLASLGMGAFASYGVISNVTYSICLTIAWVAFVKATGTTPLEPGQWKPFLAFYAGLWTIQNFVRPARFALAVALAPMFDRFITWIGTKLNIPKPAAFGMYLFLNATVTTLGLVTALYVCGGFPNGIPFLQKPVATAAA